MKPAWKPEGYSSVSPYLITADPVGVIEFLKATFGAEDLRRHDAPDGRIMHVEVRVGDSVIMMGSSGDGSTEHCHIHIYVPDVDSTYARAVVAGGKPVQAPVQKGDADKRGGVTDPVGAATWWIGTQIEANG